jgi:ketosteroid isomerase-like protein
MSQKNLGVTHNVELARASFEAIDALDVERFVALSDPQIEVHSRWAAVGEVTVYHGHDGVRRWAQEVAETWEDVRSEVEALFDLGECTLAFYTLYGRGRQSGVPSSMWFAIVARWRDGRCVYWKAYVDRGEALRELGVSEDELKAVAA